MCAPRHYHPASLRAGCLADYLAAALGLWGPQAQTYLARQAGEGCVRKIHSILVLRRGWLADSCVRAPLSVIYWPLNCLRRSQSK
jgi:hypothetical protein